MATTDVKCFVSFVQNEFLLRISTWTTYVDVRVKRGIQGMDK